MRFDNNINNDPSYRNYQKHNRESDQDCYRDCIANIVVI